MLERWANSQGFALACSVGCVKGLGETNSDTHVMATQLDSLAWTAYWSLVWLILPLSLSVSVPLITLQYQTPQMHLLGSNLSSFKLVVQTDPVVNLEFMKESLNETLIPCLVIKTSWHKLSTVLGHGGSSFYLQGSKKCSDWLSLRRKTHTPGGLTLTTCQSFLVQPALGQMLWCKHL